MYAIIREHWGGDIKLVCHFGPKQTQDALDWIRERAEAMKKEDPTRFPRGILVTNQVFIKQVIHEINAQSRRGKKIEIQGLTRRGK